MTVTPIAITGMGMVTALGSSPQVAWREVIAERSGLGNLRLFDSPRCGHFPVAEIRGAGSGDMGCERSRGVRFALHAAREAFTDAGLHTTSLDQRANVGLVLGTCTGGMLESESFMDQLVRQQSMQALPLTRDYALASATNAVAATLGLGGYRTTVSTACSSSAMAIAVAADMLERGDADVVLAVGVDTLTRLTLNGFASLLIMSATGCRPFDAERDGMNLGEGAAALVLERLSHARARAARVHACLLGWGATCDAKFATASDPEGDGIYRAMRLSLEQASLEPGDVDYLNAHGTGTRDNDVTEAKAIVRLFGSNPPPVSSTKRHFGHTLGAAGAIEAVICVLSLQHATVPGTLGLQNVDPEVPFEPLRRAQSCRASIAMSNSAGFGGNNCVLVFGSATRKHNHVTVTSKHRSSHRSADVVGVGVVSANGVTSELVLPPGAARRTIFAYRPDQPSVDAATTSIERRRLGIAQRMAITATDSALRQAEQLRGRIDPALVAVCVGSGLGNQGDTTAFLANMIERNEDRPRPANFANSVHNAIAAQVAIRFGCKAENHTFSHNEASFESALHHAVYLLESSRAGAVIVCGVDEVDPYVVAAQTALRSFSDQAQRICPMGGAAESLSGPLPGAGSASFVLMRADDSRRSVPGPTRVAHLRHVARISWDAHESDDAAANAGGRFLQKFLHDASHSIDDIDLVLLHANGRKELDDRYLRVLQAITKTTGRTIPFGVFKQRCGEYCSASGIGMAEAIRLLRGDREFAEAFMCSDPPDRGVRSVLSYQLARSGHQSACLITL